MNETEDIRQVVADIGYSTLKIEKVPSDSKMPTYFVLAFGEFKSVLPDCEYVTWMANKRESEEHFSLNWGHYFQPNQFVPKEKCEKMALKDFHRRVKDARAISR